MLGAISHARDIATGETRPQVFWCEHDGIRERWVLKLSGRLDLELATDWIGSLLAHRVGLRCPEVAIASISPEALLTAPAGIRQWAYAGPAFASLLIANTVNVANTTALLNFATPSELGAMYALDAWFDVVDRRKPDEAWNVLQDTTDGRLWMVDFGKGLSSCLYPIVGGTPVSLDPMYPSAVMAVADMAAAREACTIVENITDAEITDLVSSTPAVWMDQLTRVTVVRFLVERRGRVRECC